MANFTPGELRVMRQLWKHGEMKPAEIQARFSDQIKNPALRSYLSILLEKDHVTRRLDGKAYYYKAKTPEKNAFQSMLSELLDAFCEGSATQLLMNLVRSEKLTADQLLELRQMSSQSDSEQQTNKKKA